MKKYIQSLKDKKYEYENDEIPNISILLLLVLEIFDFDRSKIVGILQL